MLEPLSDMMEVICLSGLRASSDVEMEATALALLDAAAAMGRAREYQSARLLCARVIFQAQPLIAVRPMLLRKTMYALLVARGFKLMSHVVSAVSGRGIDVTLLPDSEEPIVAVQRNDKSRRIALLVDLRWLDLLSPDDVFLRRWCDGLATKPSAGPYSAPATDPFYRESH